MSCLTWWDRYGPRLGEVKVQCCSIGGGWSVRRLDNLTDRINFPDLRTILATDTPGEVGELTAAKLVCCHCGGTETTFAPGGTEDDPVTTDIIVCAKCGDTSMMHVTARLYLWTGEPVDRLWTCKRGPIYDKKCGLQSDPQECQVCGGELCRCCADKWGWEAIFQLAPSLTAVVLVGEPAKSPLEVAAAVASANMQGDLSGMASAVSEDTIHTAREACRQANVQFCGPGDRLELEGAA